MATLARKMLIPSIIIEVEREDRSLSTLILSSPSNQDWGTIYNYLLSIVVNAGSTWTSKSLRSIETKGINIAKAVADPGLITEYFYP